MNNSLFSLTSAAFFTNPRWSKSVIRPMLISGITTFLLGILSTNVAVAQINADYAAVPPESADSDTPQVMLSMSRDHQYFFKAYNDYTDLDPEDLTDVDADGNPVVETTYKHSFDYFGYFDPTKCYEYSSGNGEFRPVSVSADKYCSGDEWSGNFLNWGSMTRMDIVRKIFYGGSRSTDTDSETVLERAHLPLDAHSFAKYYNGDDLALLTPYNSARTNGTNGGDNDVLGEPAADGAVDDIDEGITLCNTTDNNGTGASQNSTQPPVIKAALGNFQLWNSNERWQCTFNNERNNGGNSNIPPSADDADKEFTVDGTTILVDSGIDASPLDPPVGDIYIARVQVCVDGLIGTERCKQYPNGEPKPIGLLQTYGDDALINFGLMTGSYENNIQGGVLRKNISDLSDEVDVDGDGRFIFTNTSASIIRSLDNLRVWGYRYSDGTYRGNNFQFDNCSFQLSEIPNGRCKSWGNPISEIYKESIRYMAGLTAQANFDANDENFIANLRTETWEDPLTEENQCSDLSTILINASVSSYDNDDIEITGLPGGLDGANTVAIDSTTNTWTDEVGIIEGLVGQQAFIGQNGADNNELCDAKEITALSQVLGLCPEAPTVNGSFAMAGMAYYAHNNDLRGDLEGNQTINTFAISLATNVPVIKIPRTDGGTVVQILPAYRLRPDSADPGGGALVDFRIVTPHRRITAGDDKFEGKFYISWEDSEQGGDYDQDMWGLLDYVLDESDNTVTITTTAIAESTGQPQLFGFVTNGTTQDGFHAYSGIEGANYTDTTGTRADGAVVPGCTNCRPLRGGGAATGQAGPQSYTFDISATAIAQLESPLYYAAKYGGFTESLDQDELVSLTDEPDEIEEWDFVNNTTGEEGADGLPDNFFFVINPENLFNSIEASLNKILSQNTATSSAVAAFANSNGFGSLIVQGLYQELTRQPASTGGIVRPDLNWTGEIFAYFVDDFGFFREDTNRNGQLDVYYTVDRAFRYEPVEDASPRIQYMTMETDPGDGSLVIGPNGLPNPSDTGATVGLSDLNFLWNAGDSLRALNNESTREQRNYDSAVPTGSATTQASRYIFTYIDEDLDGEVDAGEQLPFTTDAIDAANFGFLGVGSEAAADAIVDYIRGYEDPNIGFRNRTLVEADGTETVYRLGDLINSRPLVVERPQAAYDTRFGDESYEEFYEQYRNRRNMVYIGGNDGLLHAFNGGFTKDIDADQAGYIETGGDGNHPLGTEIWAYAPYNLLPHMQWLTNNFYSHVYYVDGSPQAFDVKIFNDDAKHPGGWGTILVVGMRQGGGDFPVNQGGIATTTTSAYIVLDVTDPEDPPELLAEITHPDLNMTTSQPDIFYDCELTCNQPDNNQNDNFDGEWKLIFGSGPADLQDFTTNETAKVFAYDLESGDLDVEEIEVTNGSVSAPVPDSFVGSVATADWDNGKLGFRNDDVVYYGLVGTRDDTGTADPDDVIETGGIYRYFPGDLPAGVTRRTSLFLDTDRPMFQKPTLASRENLGNDVLGSWIFAGTGIYLTRDNEETASQERFYGLLETANRTEINNLNNVIRPTGTGDEEDSRFLTYETVTENDLIDVSDIGVLRIVNQPRETRPLVNPPTTSAGTLTTTGALAKYITEFTQGWFIDIPIATVAGDPSGRITDSATAFIDQLLFVTFTPGILTGENICAESAGSAELFIVDQTTGVPIIGTLGATSISAGGATPENERSIDVGSAPVKSPIVSTSESQGPNSGTIILQRGDGSILTKDDGQDLQGADVDAVPTIRAGWRELNQIQ